MAHKKELRIFVNNQARRRLTRLHKQIKSEIPIEVSLLDVARTALNEGLKVLEERAEMKREVVDAK